MIIISVKKNNEFNKIFNVIIHILYENNIYA